MTSGADNTNSLFAIVGAGGCGRGVMPVAAEMLERRRGAGDYELVFADDALAPSTVNNRRVITCAELAADNSAERFVSIAIANSTTRSRLAEQCIVDGVQDFSVVASNAVIFDDVEVGAGAIICPFVTLTSNIRIGRYFHANLYSYVEHDCVIGDFVTFAPGVQCNGNVTIEDHAYLGAGCMIKHGLPGEPLVIGHGAVVGMGAVVTKSVPPGVTVVGNPARPMKKK